MKAGLAGEDLQKITACTAKLAAVRMIRAKFDCLPTRGISASMRSWLDHNLVQTPLQLASKVAAGALRTDSLVDSTVTSSLETLGQGQQVQEMFQLFGMNSRALPKLQMDTKASPSSYISLANVWGCASRRKL